MEEDRLARRLALVEEHVRIENTHDLGGVMSTFGDHPVFEDAPWEEAHRGRHEVTRYYEELFAAAPDLTVDIHRRYVAEEAVILECTIRGTHLGAWRGLPPTGRSLDFRLCAVYTFEENDQLAGERIYYDRATLLRQVGVFHEPESLAGRLATVLTHPLTIAGAVARMIRSRTPGAGFGKADPENESEPSTS